MSHSRPGRFNVCLLWPIVCFGLLGGVVCSTAAAESPVDFAQDVRPLLSDTCYHCHGPDKKGRDSELRLDTRDGAFADLGGYRAIEPGDASKSELLRRITSDDPELHMPPVDSGRKLTAGQIDLLRR
ncbi:MAG: hypothetical protein KDA41_19845, partial [Planctomycetales bacterium]|nr:hypothetical protein [Planctomycetales bacterium]